MKKIFSLLTALLFLLAAGCAAAETTVLLETVTGESIVLEHDKTLKMTKADSPDPGNAHWTISTSGCASVSLSIAPSEIDGTLSLEDLSESEQLKYGEMVGAMFASPEITLQKTPSGILYVQVCSNEESDIDTLLTIHNGYFIELVQYNEDFSQLTKADQDFCRNLLNSVRFVGAK